MSSTLHPVLSNLGDLPDETIRQLALNVNYRPGLCSISELRPATFRMLWYLCANERHHLLRRVHSVDLQPVAAHLATNAGHQQNFLFYNETLSRTSIEVLLARKLTKEALCRLYTVCLASAPAQSDFQEEISKRVLGKVDVDAMQDLCKNFPVHHLPIPRRSSIAEYWLGGVDLVEAFRVTSSNRTLVEKISNAIGTSPDAWSTLLAVIENHPGISLDELLTIMSSLLASI